VQSTLPVAPWNSALTLVTPAFTPTTTPELLTVAVFESPVDQSDVLVTSSFVPFGSVATADICTELVRPTAQGDGDIAMADTDDDDAELPQAARETRPRTVHAASFIGAVTSRTTFSTDQAMRGDVAKHGETPAKGLARAEKRHMAWRGAATRGQGDGLVARRG
jgi:hypothetical protein